MTPQQPTDGLLDGELRFPVSRAKVSLALVGSLVLVAVALLFTAERPIVGWVAVAFCALCAAGALKMLVGDEFYLRLTREGFEIAGLLRHREYRWAEIEPIQVGTIRGLRFLSVVPRGHGGASGLRAALWRRFREGATVGDFYASPIDDIHQTLNAWREHYGARESARR
jgi:hypothetical protein